MSKLFKRVSGITLGLALCFGFSFSCSNKQSSNQMARAANGDSLTGGDMSNDLPSDWTASGTGTYKGNGIKFDTAGDYIISPDISSNSLKNVKVSLKAGHNGGQGSVLTIAALGASNNVLDSEDFIPTEAYTSQSTVYDFELDSSSTISFVKISMKSKTKNLGMKYCEVFDNTSSGGSTKLTAPNLTFDRANSQVTWESVDNASSYDLSIDGGEAIHNATSPYSISSYSSGEVHTASIIAVGDGTNYTNSSSSTVKFGVFGHAGTEEDPFTVADAKLLIDITEGVTDTVYATGIVSKFFKNAGSRISNGQISYYISADGTTSDELEAYNGKGLNGALFESEDEIQIGDVVVIKGKLKKYNSTYEFDANNELVSLVRHQAPVLEYLTISGTPSKTTYKTTDTSWSHDGLTVNAHYDNSSVVDVTSSVTWSYDLESPAALGEGNPCLTITASYGGESTYIDVDVTIEAVVLVDTYHLSGKRYIYEQTSAEAAPVYMNIDNASGTKNPDQVSSKGQASAFLFTLVGDDTYTITNLDRTKGLYYPGSSNTLRWGTNGKDYEWVVNDDVVVKTVDNEPVELYGTYNFVGKDNDDNLNRYMCAYGSDWRTYNAANASNRTAKLQVEAAKDVAGFSVDTTNANKNVLKGSTFDAAAAEQAGFEPRINYTDNSYDEIACNAVEWVLETSVVNSEAVLYVHYLTYDIEITGMNIYAPTMVSLSINATNAKTSYLVGDALDISGITIKGVDASDNEYDLEISQCTYSPANGDTLSTEDTSVTASYVNENNTVATGSYAISVNVFTGFTKITSVDDLEVGASYVIGVDTSNPTYKLMGSINDASAAKSYRNAVDASSVTSTDATRVLDTASSVVGASTFTLLKNNDGQYAFYDLGVSKYLVGFTNNGDNSLNNSDTAIDLKNDTVWWNISFSSGIASVTLKGTDRVLGFNSGTTPTRFATYAGYTSNITHIALFKMNGSSIKTNVETFANDWLKMNDSNYDGDIETPNCAENYGLLKLAYADLNEAEKNVLQYCDDFADARARLNAWATANGEVFTYGNETPFESLRRIGANGDIISGQDDNTLIVLLSVFSLGVSALSAFYLVKKRKRA